MGTTRTWRGIVFAALTAGLCGLGAGTAVADSPASSAAAADSASANLTAIRDRAETMPIDRRIDMEKRIRATVDRVNDAVASEDKSALAARLAPGFAMTAGTLLDEKGRLGWSWGDLVVARALLADANTKVTLFDLEALRADGLGWPAIAYGLQFHMEDLEDVIRAGGRIAEGIAKPGGAYPNSP